MDRNVIGKVVVVTGGAEGLGLAMVNSFLEKGAKLAVIVDMNEKKGTEAEKLMRSKYGSDKAVFYKCNVLTDCDTVGNKLLDEHKDVDLLVNNAGVLDELNIKRTINVNITALMEWTVKFYDHMRIDKGGKGGTVINVSSIYGYRIIPYIPYYHASKFAVIGFSRSMGHETNFNKSGVRVVTLCPGLTHTNMTEAPHINLREEDLLEEFKTSLVGYDWQHPKDIGNGTVEIFEKADSGSVWLVEGARPAEQLNL